MKLVLLITGALLATSCGKDDAGKNLPVKAPTLDVFIEAVEAKALVRVASATEPERAAFDADFKAFIEDGYPKSAFERFTARAALVRAEFETKAKAYGGGAAQEKSKADFNDARFKDFSNLVDSVAEEFDVFKAEKTREKQSRDVEAEFEAFIDEVCACKDMECYDAASEKMAKKNAGKRAEAREPSKKMLELTAKMTKCVTDLTRKASDLRDAERRDDDARSDVFYCRTAKKPTGYHASRCMGWAHWCEDKFGSGGFRPCVLQRSAACYSRRGQGEKWSTACHPSMKLCRMIAAEEYTHVEVTECESRLRRQLLLTSDGFVDPSFGEAQ